MVSIRGTALKLMHVQPIRHGHMRLHRPRHARLATIYLTLIVGFTLAVPGLANAAASQGCADDTSAITDKTAAWESELLRLTNAHRTGMGLVALKLDATLTRASVWKSRDLARRNYFAHDDQATATAPARSPWDRLSACGWTTGGSRAENIAAGYDSAAAVITGWLNSAGHRANIENAAMRYVGFGVAHGASSTYGDYSVQMFASVAGPTGATPIQPPPPPAPPAPPSVRALTLVVGQSAHSMCPSRGTTFVLEAQAGMVDASISAAGCLVVTPRANSGGTSSTIVYRARTIATDALSAPVDLVVTVTDRDRTPQGTDPTTDLGDGALRTSTYSATTATIARVRCRGRWAVNGWCYRVVVRGRVLVDGRASTAGRRVVISRAQIGSSGTRHLVAARTMTRAGGAFAASTRIKPPARATAAWLTRNASRIRITAPGTADAAAATTWRTARVRR